MKFTPGQSGNPGGRAKGKPWADALRRALARKGSDAGVDGGLNAIADQVIALAAEGDKDAWKEIGDRLDGKPVQSNEHSGPDGQPIPIRGVLEFIRPDGKVEVS